MISLADPIKPDSIAALYEINQLHKPLAIEIAVPFGSFSLKSSLAQLGCSDHSFQSLPALDSTWWQFVLSW